MKQIPQWKKAIDSIHQKHLNHIQPDRVHGLAFHYTSPVGLLGIILTVQFHLAIRII